MPRRSVGKLRLLAALLGIAVGIGLAGFPARAQDRAFACSIEWTRIAGSRDLPTLRSFARTCGDTPAAAKAQERIKQLRPPPPPPPNPDQLCKSRWKRIGYTRDVRVLRSFIGDCGRTSVGETAKIWLADVIRPAIPVLTAEQLFDNAEAAKVRRDYGAARRDWLSACNMRLAVACNNLGSSYSESAHGTPNYGYALFYWDLGCSLNQSKSCDNARIATSDLGYGQVDLSKSRSYYERFLSVANASGASKTPECTGGFAKSCLDLGNYYFKNDTSSMSSDRQFALYAWSCNGGSAIACGNAGAVSSKVGRIKEMRDYLKKGCDGRDGVSCYLLAGALNNPATGTVQPDLARDRMTRACTLGYKDACGTQSFNGSQYFQNK